MTDAQVEPKEFPDVLHLLSYMQRKMLAPKDQWNPHLRVQIPHCGGHSKGGKGHAARRCGPNHIR
jgi:hypothetical protein